MRYLKRLAVAAAALALTAGAALARPAVSETDLNVRSGPGTSYPVIGVLQRGESADVGECVGSWCRVGFAGGTGWASARYLAFGGAVVPAAPPPAVVYDDPYFYDYDDFYYAPGIAFIGPRFRHHRHFHGYRRWSRDHGRWAGRRALGPGRTVTTSPRFNRRSIGGRTFNRSAFNRGAFSRGNVGMRSAGFAARGGVAARSGNVGMRSSGSFRSGGSMRSGGGFRGGGFARGGGGDRRR